MGTPGDALGILWYAAGWAGGALGMLGDAVAILGDTHDPGFLGNALGFLGDASGIPVASQGLCGHPCGSKGLTWDPQGIPRDLSDPW